MITKAGLTAGYLRSLWLTYTRVWMYSQTCIKKSPLG